MVHIPPGKFLMGSYETEVERHNYEDQKREIIINYAFEIGKYEVTFDEYAVFASATKRKLLNENFERGKYPVVNVSFDDT